MKQILICRHSKSEPPDLPSPDSARNLTPVGRQDAAAIGREIAERGYKPDVILSSDSLRARQTTAQITTGLPYAPKIKFLSELYSATGSDILNIVADHAAEAQIILVVGHNPGMEELVSRIASRNVHLGTSTVAVLAIDGAQASERAPFAGLRLSGLFGPNGDESA